MGHYRKIGGREKREPIKPFGLPSLTPAPADTRYPAISENRADPNPRHLWYDWHRRLSMCQKVVGVGRGYPE